MTDLCVIDGKETVGHIGNLFKCLAFPAYFKQIFVVNKEISLFGVSRLAFHKELAVEERFALVAFVNV